MRKYNIALIILLAGITAFSQQKITSETFQPYTIHFSLDKDHLISGVARETLLKAIEENQFVGLAEVHQSQQLSFFTIGFLELLKEKDFNAFAIEIGPISAQIVKEQSVRPEKTAQNLKIINQRYGKKSFPKIPLIFIDKVEDAQFIEVASRLEYDIWGLDQEFSYSYEMHLDRIYGCIRQPTIEIEKLYQECKSLVRENIFKSKVSGQSKNCWFQNEPNLQKLFHLVRGNLEAEKIITALKASWDIYCRNEKGMPSNQLRADYMKSNFEQYFSSSMKIGVDPKVFVKLGGVHLTRGNSIFSVNDVGKFLTEKANELNTGFLTIRHLSRYKNGKDLTGKKGWKGVELFMQTGKKDLWTLVDLRPLRQLLEEGNFKADQNTAFEIYNYDLLLIPPDDKKSTLNY